jgi:putative ABC transport system permease protein
MLRRILVVAQFSISIVLIVATLITLKQLRYLNDRELGYTKDQVITLRYFGDLASNYDAFFNELVKQSSIENIARSSRTPTGRLLDSQGAGRIQKGDSLSDTNVVLKDIRIDQEFFSTYEIEFAAGRDFSKDITTDDSLAFILNEAAVKMMGMTSEEIVDKEFQYAGVKGRVIGVVKDFHFESLHEPIVPIVFEPGKNFNNISIKLAGDNLQAGLAHVESTWRELLPERPFEFEFLSAKYQRLYDSEQRQGQLFIIFASLAILIACLGLFGLATFNAMQRVKEIGIRKVLGASVPSILTLLSREIVVLMVVANLIAWPVAWYFMDMWLGTFAYHINMDILAYLMAGGAAVVIALVTVSSQTIKAATNNPANTLRYE